MLETTRDRFFRKGSTLQRTPLIVFLSCCLSVYLSGCATTYPANPPLQQSDPTAGYEYANVAEALDRLSGSTQAEDLVLVCGSFLTVTEALEWLIARA